MKIKYQACDGALFDTEEDAVQHETDLKEKDRERFVDLVNELVIVMERSNIFTDEDFQRNGDFMVAEAARNFEFGLLAKLKAVKTLDYDVSNFYSSECYY